MSQSENIVIIEAGHSESLYWKDIWAYRALFFFLAWRDILVRYKQTMIGVAWSIIRPLLTMIVFTVIFGKIAKLPSNGVPYPIMVFSAMLPWQFFSNGLSESSNSLIANANMLTKIYFPRLIVPVSTIITNIVDFLISLVILIILMAWFGFMPSKNVVTLPIFMILLIIVTTGSGLLLAALNVKYRDFRYVVPFIIQFGLYVSPVGFSSSIVPERWRLLYYVNPMAGIIDGFRWAILGGDTHVYWPGALLSTAILIAILISGLAYFRKTERTFADVI